MSDGKPGATAPANLFRSIADDARALAGLIQTALSIGSDYSLDGTFGLILKRIQRCLSQTNLEMTGSLADWQVVRQLGNRVNAIMAAAEKSDYLPTSEDVTAFEYAAKRIGEFSAQAADPSKEAATQDTPIEKRQRWTDEWRAKLGKEFPDLIGRMQYLAFQCANETYWQWTRESWENLKKAKESQSETFRRTRERLEMEHQRAGTPDDPAKPLWFVKLRQFQADPDVKQAEQDLENADRRFWEAGLPSGELYGLLYAHRPLLLQDYGPATWLDESYTPRERAEKCVAVHAKLVAETAGQSTGNGAPKGETTPADSTATPADEPANLTATAKAALRIIQAEKGGGLAAKEIVKRLANERIEVAESTFYRHIVPQLTEHGVKNERARGGYYDSRQVNEA